MKCATIGLKQCLLFKMVPSYMLSSWQRKKWKPSLVSRVGSTCLMWPAEFLKVIFSSSATQTSYTSALKHKPIRRSSLSMPNTNQHKQTLNLLTKKSALMLERISAMPLITVLILVEIIMVIKVVEIIIAEEVAAMAEAQLVWIQRFVFSLRQLESPIFVTKLLNDFTKKSLQ